MKNGSHNFVYYYNTYVKKQVYFLCSDQDMQIALKDHFTTNNLEYEQSIKQRMGEV